MEDALLNNFVDSGIYSSQLIVIAKSIKSDMREYNLDWSGFLLSDVCRDSVPNVLGLLFNVNLIVLPTLGYREDARQIANKPVRRKEKTCCLADNNFSSS